MAAALHNPSRRALLGAALAIPLLPIDGGGSAVDSDLGNVASGAEPGSTSTPTLPSPLEGEELAWRRALGAVERAEAGVGAVERRSAGASHAEQFALEDLYGDRLGDLYAAIRRLIRTPSPDLAALTAKIVFTVDREIASFDWGERCMRALKRDALRLAALRSGDAR